MKELKSEKEWKKLLSPEEYNVLREKGTERAFTGKYWNFFEKGIYKCAACGQILFDSETKYDAGCGWPSFSDAVSNKNLLLKDDFSFGMHRIEVMCSNCGGHLGHVFDDGPKPLGKRYCINSVSIKFDNIKNNK
ncbi:MAG: peptide-methionine (R)-S-oxide reductase MsrB [Bacteroidota bacterium]